MMNNNMMNQIQKIQRNIAEEQEKLKNLEVSGEAGGGLVKVTMSATGDMKGVKIKPSIFEEGDVEVLEDLIIAAVHAAKKEGEEESEKRMSNLGIPPQMLKTLGLA